MPVKHGTLIHRYDYHPKLGRHQVLDARSLSWLHEHAGTMLRPTAHTPRIPVLDQDHLLEQGIRVSQVVAGAEDAKALSSCTGQAGTVAVSFLLDDLAALQVGLDYADAKGCEEWAIGLYAQATGVDEFAASTFPPDDAGSSGLGVAKTLKRRGLVSSYTHATDVTALASLLQAGPVLMGVPWFEAWFEPDTDGFVDVGSWASSQVVGGHEVCVIGLERVAQDHAGRVIAEQSVIRFRNSWSASWGDGGDGLMSLATYQLLRAHIDALQLQH